MNPTTITEPEEIAQKHFLDSLTALGEIPDDARVIDVGTGAGFPGIPLKIMKPSISLVLLDSLQKRLTFLEEVCRQLGLDGVTLVHARAEEAAHDPLYREQFQVVTARALAYLPTLLEYSSGYAAEGGKLLLYKGASFSEEAASAVHAAKVLNVTLEKTIDTQETLGLDHHVAVYLKGKSLALQYPRKASRIKNSPL